MTRIYILPLCLSLALSACSVIPPEAYSNRGGPEALLNSSSEYVTVSLASESALDELSGWVSKDQPTRAELFCQDGNPVCSQAQDTLQQFGVPVTVTASEEGNAVLVYERLTARDCNPRFISNHINPYNLNHPSFGCANAANALQMVSDRQQITSPSLMDYPDAERGALVYRSYLSPIDSGANKEFSILAQGSK